MKKHLSESEIMDSFLAWVKEPIEEKFTQYRPLGGRVLLRLFYFRAEDDEKTKLYTDMISENTVQNKTKSQLFPIAKIIAVGNGVSEDFKTLQPGDLVTVSDFITGSKENPKWRDYQRDILEKPGMKDKVHEPPMFVGYVTQWQEYVFIQDKFSPKLTIEDAYTFLLPERYIQTKYEK